MRDVNPSSNLKWRSFIQPVLLPDELASAFREVVATANNFPNWFLLSQAIRGTSRAHKDLTQTELLASQSSLSAKDLVVHHTLTPLTQAFTRSRNRPLSEHGVEAYGIQRAYLRLARKKIFLCPACAESDARTYGRSYWRRTHQAPGIDWCPQHWEPLVGFDKSHMNQAPLALLRQLRAPSRVALAPPTESFFRRYVDLVMYFLRLPSPISVTSLKEVLRNSVPVVDQSVTPLNQKSVPSSGYSTWIAELFVGFQPPIESATEWVLHRGIPSYKACILALAMSFDTASAAIDALRRSYQIAEDLPDDLMAIWLPAE